MIVEEERNNRPNCPEKIEAIEEFARYCEETQLLN